MFKRYLLLLIGLFVGVFSVIHYTFAESFSQKLKGTILIQVENKGEAWYVDPIDSRRYFLGKPEDAFKVMRERGVGISDNDLDTIAIGVMPMSGKDTDNDKLSDAFEEAIKLNPESPDSDGDGYSDYTELITGHSPYFDFVPMSVDLLLTKKLKGKILLQVQHKGEAWYLNPLDSKRYFLGRPQDAYNVMRQKGIGISNKDINKITQGASAASSTSITFLCGSMITDRDGYIYKTVKIGTQCWMAENLKTKTKPNGSLLTNSTENSERDCIAQSNVRGTESDCEAGNTLYTWDGAMAGNSVEKAQGLCPASWHIPTDNEWHILELYLAGYGSDCRADRIVEEEDYGGDCEFAGAKLIEGPSDASGFNGIPSGARYIFDSGENHFDGWGEDMNFWSSSSTGVSRAWTRSAMYGGPGIYRGTSPKTRYANSVRCIKN